MSQRKVLSFGILGAANIAPNALISPSKLLSDTCKVVGVAARDKAKAKKYADKYGIPKVFETYEDLINSSDIDVVYIPLPNGHHAEWTIKAIKAGKHVLCEKPFTSNSKEAELVKSIHDESKVSLVEAFHYRYHPVAKKVKDLITNEIGKLKSISIEFSLPSYITYLAFGDDDIRFNYKLAGGITMDAGCYCINALLYFGGAVDKVVSAKPTILRQDIDSGMVADLDLKNGAKGKFIADFKSSNVLPVMLSVHAIGEDGQVYCNNLLGPSYWHYITLTKMDGSTKTIKEYGDGNTTYYYQLKAFCQEVNGGQKCETTPQESIEIMKVVDEVYEKAGMSIRPSNLKQ